MSLFALIAAFLLEQLHPLASRKAMVGGLSGYATFFEHQFNAGEKQHGAIAWMLATVPLLLVLSILYWLLDQVHPVFAWALCVLVLYLTMGFRQFSHYFTDIHVALRDGKLEEARSLLSQWRGIPSHELNAEEVARVAIEQAILASHRHVFGVVVWFVLLMAIGLGPVGAVLYRVTHFLHARWGKQSIEEGGQFGIFARQAFCAMEWLPIRITAATFAIVGDFEDTAFCWRTQAASWPSPEEGVLLASGAGALGVRLGGDIQQETLPEFRPEIGVGEAADVDFMQSAIGLVWRSVVFWLFMLLLLTLANLLG